MRRHTSGASLQLVDSDSERSAEHRRVVRHLHVQVKFLATLKRNRRTKHATCMLQHKVHLFRRDFLGGDNEVSLILTILIVYHYQEFSFLEIRNSVFNAV